MSLNCTDAVFHSKTRLVDCFTVKISFVYLSTLALNCTNVIFHNKTPLFECFAKENLICASVNSDFNSHKCGIPLQWEVSFVQ